MISIVTLQKWSTPSGNEVAAQVPFINKKPQESPD